MTFVLEGLGLCKRFTDRQALAGVDVRVEAGRIHGLLGPNGAGKTTLIRILLDIQRADDGVVLWRGNPRSRDDLDRIGYLPEERGIYRRQTVSEVLRYFGQLKGLGRGAADDQASHWLRRLGIGDFGPRKVEALSKGNQQRVQILATLMGEPELLIWDEPFSGLDPVGVVELTALLREMVAEGRTVVLSTHLMPQAEALCDRVVLLSQGRVVLEGEVAALVEGTVVDFVEVERRRPDGSFGNERLACEGATPERVLRGILDAGAEVRAFRPIRPSLEQIFLRAVGSV